MIPLVRLRIKISLGNAWTRKALRRRLLFLVFAICIVRFLFICLSWVACASRPDRIGCAARGFQRPTVTLKTSTVPEIIFIAMGQAELFSRWYDFLSKTNTSRVRVILLYGSYDSPVSKSEADRCHQASWTQDFVDCRAHYIPNTTWTQARNLLARDALVLEREHGRIFDFWSFADDDADLHCPDDQRFGQRECWQQYMEYVGQVRGLSSKITTIAPAYTKWKRSNGWESFTTADAIVATFPREFVPFFLPYALPSKGLSEWISQAALFCVMLSCFPSSVMSPPHLFTENPKHRDYTRRNFNHDTIMRTVNNNYGAFINFRHCAKFNYSQGQQRIGPFDSVHELIDNIPSQNQSFCAPLKQRFSDWAQVMTNLF